MVLPDTTRRSVMKLAVPGLDHRLDFLAHFDRGLRGGGEF